MALLCEKNNVEYSIAYCPKTGESEWSLSINEYSTLADELGYISLTEMESISGPLGIGIEQDMYFQQKRLSEYVKKWR